MSDKRALTKFLRCVEWSDVQVRHLSNSHHCTPPPPPPNNNNTIEQRKSSLLFDTSLIWNYWIDQQQIPDCFFISNELQEAKHAIDLMGRWETIDVTDALELLSPVFESEEVSLNSFLKLILNLSHIICLIIKQFHYCTFEPLSVILIMLMFFMIRFVHMLLESLKGLMMKSFNVICFNLYKPFGLRDPTSLVWHFFLYNDVC